MHAGLTRVLRRVATARDQFVYGFLCWFSFLAVAVADRNPLWVDEQITRELIQRWTVWELLTVLPAWQPHFPTWYLLPELAGWGAASLVSLVALPVTVYATIRAALAVYDRPDAAYIAGVLVATSPFLSVQAGWVRMYAPLTAVLTVGFWLGLDARYRQAAVAMLAASLMHVFGAFGAVWLALHAFRRGRRRLAVGVGIAGCLPAFLLLALNTTSEGVTAQSTGMGHGITPGLLEVVLTPVSSLLGSPHTSIQVVGVLVVTLLLLVPYSDRRVVSWILLPVVGIPLASMLVHPVFRLKYYGFVAPGVALLVAHPRRSRWHQAAVSAVIVGLLLLMWLQRQIPVLVTRRFIFWF